MHERRSAGARAGLGTSVAFAVLALAVTYLVAHDGTLVGQVLRALTALSVVWLLWWSSASLDSPLRGALVCGTGLVGITIGVGISVPHLAGSGPAAVTIAGLSCLAAGLWLLVAGARAMLRHRRWWVTVPSIVGLVLVMGAMLLTGGQAIAATNVPPTRLGPATPERYGLDYRDASMMTDDGVTLSAWYIPSASGAAVVLRHGAGSTRTDTLEQAAALAGEGFGVLMMDARGHGLSGGQAMDFGWYGDLDVSAGVDYLAEQPDVDDDRIGAVGLSMGGEEVIGAAAADPRIRAVVAEGATARQRDDKAWMPSVHGLAGTLQQQLDRATFGLTDLLTSARPPTSLRDAAEKAAPRPMLLIAAGTVEDEPSAARMIQSGAPKTVETWVVPTAGHIAGLATEPEEWPRRVAGFLQAALRAGSQ